MKNFVIKYALAVLAQGLIAQSVNAHVSFVNEPAFAASRYMAVANIPHGCSDESGNHYDTVKVEIQLPAGFTEARPLDNAFGHATAETDGEGNVTKFIWTRSGEPKVTDSHMYQFAFYGRLPSEPMTTLEFPTTQTCVGDYTAVWAGANVPKLRVLPKRFSGWNKYTAQDDIDLDGLKAFFADAQIVWSNGSAYSANPVTALLIDIPLTNIPVGAEFWVKY